VDTKLVALGETDGRAGDDQRLQPGNKIAQLRGVDVININDLANALKPVVLPGEAMHVKIIKPGEEIGQGVATWRTARWSWPNRGATIIGEEVTLVVTSVLQTSAGRMIFGRMEGAPPPQRRGVRR
jgi:uncharacterized protein YacL